MDCGPCSKAACGNDVSANFARGHQLFDNIETCMPDQPVADDPPINPEWLAEFEAAAARPLETRLKYAFIHTYKPVLDDAPYRSFETTQEYREWCNYKLPRWLGYASD